MIFSESFFKLSPDEFPMAVVYLRFQIIVYVKFLFSRLGYYGRVAILSSVI